MIDTELYKKNEISVFFDIGTNGELVIGNKEFLLCGAGAAGPALEGGVVRTGMRADIGAVDEVKIRDGNIFVHVIGNSAPQGICGSGIIDLIAELFPGRLDRHPRQAFPGKKPSYPGERQPALCGICPRSVLLPERH